MADYNHDSDDVQVCRICLESEARLIALDQMKLVQVYQLIGSQCMSDVYPKYLCQECAMRLKGFAMLRWKAIRSQELMRQILDGERKLTTATLKSIDRLTNKLTSSLNVKHYTGEETKIIEYDELEQLFSMDLVTEDSGLYIEKVEVDRDSDSDTSQDVPLLELKEQKKTKRKKPKTVAEKPKIDRRRRPLLNPDLKETLFTITDLTTEEQLAELRKREESTNFKSSPYKCMECFKGFLDEDAYNGHVVRHTEKCGEFKCDVCKINYVTRNALRKHITAHHTQRFSCNLCDYVTTHRQTARLHERWHKGTKYQCPHCQEVFYRFTTYMGHVRIKHPSDFVCSLCGHSFVSSKGIELHKKLKHRLDDDKIPENGPRCDECDVTFATIDAFHKHMQISNKHNTTQTTEKPPCRSRRPRGPKAKSLDIEKDRKVAFQKRKADGPIPCEQCGLQLEDSRAYHGHFRRAHPDKNRTKYPSMKTPTMCEVCGKIFQSYSLLKDHTWQHTGEKPFKCDLCPKTFTMKQRLVAHRHVHSQERASYACSVCGKSFSSPSNRQRHMFIHTGLKPFQCELCGKAFKMRSEKRAHVAYVHFKKPWPKRQRRRNDRDANIEMEDQSWEQCTQKTQDMPDKNAYYLE